LELTSQSQQNIRNLNNFRPLCATPSPPLVCGHAPLQKMRIPCKKLLNKSEDVKSAFTFYSMTKKMLENLKNFEILCDLSKLYGYLVIVMFS